MIGPESCQDAAGERHAGECRARDPFDLVSGRRRIQFPSTELVKKVGVVTNDLHMLGRILTLEYGSRFDFMLAIDH